MAGGRVVMCFVFGVILAYRKTLASLFFFNDKKEK